MPIIEAFNMETLAQRLDMLEQVMIELKYREDFIIWSDD